VSEKLDQGERIIEANVFPHVERAKLVECCYELG
jgi:hypothetical protein